MLKTFLFENFPDMSQEQKLENLEGSNVGVEPSHEFLRPFSPEEVAAKEEEFLNDSKELSRIENQITAMISPLKAEMKPIRQRLAQNIEVLKKGGEQVTEKVYLFPDYENKMMGLYDKNGYLISQRPFSRQERQLHINSGIFIKTVNTERRVKSWKQK